jgi:hypothetical protein
VLTILLCLDLSIPHNRMKFKTISMTMIWHSPTNTISSPATPSLYFNSPPKKLQFPKWGPDKVSKWLCKCSFLSFTGLTLTSLSVCCGCHISQSLPEQSVFLQGWGRITSTVAPTTWYHCLQLSAMLSRLDVPTMAPTPDRTLKPLVIF